jgi:hypothetical protein
MVSCGECAFATDGDGRFSLAVRRAGGHLIIKAREYDYRVVAADAGTLLDGVKRHATIHANAILPINPVSADRQPEMKVELSRGVSIKGVVVKPDGSPLEDGLILCRRRVCLLEENVWPVFLTPGGKFCLDGCESGQVEKVIVVDPSGQWGAVTELTPSESSMEMVTVRAERCGQASVTVVDAKNNPVAGEALDLTFCLPERHAVSKSPPPADPEDAWVPLQFFNKTMITDSQGKAQLPPLVPGTTYRIVSATKGIPLSDPFEALPGQKLEIAIRIPRR